MERCPPWISALIGSLALLLALSESATAQQPEAGMDNAACLACHSNPSITYQFPSGEVWPLTIDPASFDASVHGQKGVRCTACHTDITGYPHPPLTVASRRYYELEHYKSCERCHPQVYRETLDSVHARQIAAGNWAAAICTDCHDPHRAPTQPPRLEIPVTCSKCHAAIYNEYRESVHGKALIEADNLDVPTCTDCHGVHTQEDPRTTRFRLNSPKLCATCHADPDKMAQYGLSADVFDTYVADFHGTTVVLFERQSPDLPTNKPVCYDCHGVHNMKSAKDPDSQVYRDNLLKTCQRCHPDASANFSSSWLSHYRPDARRFPLVFFVDLFYKIFIPAVIGFMGLYVVLDFSGRVTRRWRRRSSEEAE
ncbi:MAG: cytochrome c3 family protein [Anaerolineae bacterium]|nr:cytochrome c3 family protein [Anaerolineae bacterium]MDW8070504.1 cytochrome c3 family protein [Anaerolineae bacterium]